MNTVQQDHPARHYVERMVASVNSLFGSTGNAGFQARQLQFEEVDIAEYLNSASEHEWGGTVEDVAYTGPAAGLLCRLDPDALEDSLTNILNNAQRFREPGTSIEVQLAAEGGSATIRVGNHGKQITAEMLPVAFEWKVSETPRGEGSNQGIGLWVARYYIEQMEGDISIRNTGQGVEVRIALPLIRKHPPRIGQGSPRIA